MKVSLLWLVAMMFTACRTTPLENVQQLVNSHEYAGALELLNSQEIDSTDIESLSLLAISYFAETNMTEGFKQIDRIAGSGDDGRIQAATVLLRSGRIAAREKIRASDAVALLDSAVLYDPSTTTDVVGLAWQRGLEFLNSSGDAGRLFINCAIGHDSNTAGRLRAHDIILSRRYEELESVVASLPEMGALGNRYFTEFGKFPTILEIQSAYPEVGVRNREGWEITIDGREGKIVAIATASLGNKAGVKRGTVLTGN